MSGAGHSASAMSSFSCWITREISKCLSQQDSVRSPKFFNIDNVMRTAVARPVEVDFLSLQLLELSILA